MKVLEYYEQKTGIAVIRRTARGLTKTWDDVANGVDHTDLSSASSSSTATSASGAMANRVVVNKNSNGPAPRHLLMTLAELFVSIYQQKKRTGNIGPKQFIEHLRKENGMSLFF